MKCPWCDAPADVVTTLSGEPWGYFDLRPTSTLRLQGR